MPWSAEMDNDVECGEDVVGIIRRSSQSSGCSVVWLTRLVWDQEIAGSNPVIPTAARAAFMPWSAETDNNAECGENGMGII